MLDEYLEGAADRISPEAPVPILKVETRKHVLGGAANTAANISSLGGKAVLVGAVGEDPEGNEFRSLCQRRNIEFHNFGDNRPTLRKTRLLGRKQQLLRLDYEDTSDLPPTQQNQILEFCKKQLPQCQALVLSDYAKGFFTQSLSQDLISEAKSLKIPVIADPRPQHAAFYHGCDYLTPNWNESISLCHELKLDLGPTGTKDPSIDKVGNKLAPALNSHILMTLGPKGIALFDRQGKFLISSKTRARDVFDVSGAGDTVVASFALSLAAGSGANEAMHFANHAAGIVVGKSGTATVTPEELKGWEWEDSKLLQRNELARWAEDMRSRGRKIVTMNGSFDLLHAGHLHILNEAADQGDVLLVGLNSDTSIKAYKGEDRPIIEEKYRAEMLLSLRCVDYVHIFDEQVPMPFLEQIIPDVHVNGSEYGENCVEAPTVQKGGGRIHIVRKIAGLSTSEIVRKIQGMGENPI